MFGPAVTRQEKFFRLERPFTTKDVRTRFRKASLKWHPDQNPHRRIRAKELFVKIVEAKNFLLELLSRYNGILHPPKKEKSLSEIMEEFLKENSKKATSASDSLFWGEEYGSKTVVLNVLLKKYLHEIHESLGLWYDPTDRKRTLIYRLRKKTWIDLNGAFRQKHKNRIRRKLPHCSS